MKTITTEEGRAQLSDLVTLAEKGSEIPITRHGIKVARLVHASFTLKKIPSLKEFRDTINVKRNARGQTVIQERRRQRS